MKQPCKRLNINALLTEEVRGNFQRTLNHQLEELSKPSEGPPDVTTLTAEWESITNTILSTAKSTLGVMHKRHQDWFDTNRKEIHVILHEKNSAYKAHLQQPKSAAHYQRWIRIRSQVQHHLREMRNSWWKTKAQEIQEHANNNNIRPFYEALKSVFGPSRRSFCHVKDSSGTLLIKERDGILSRWAEHFNTLLNKRNPSDTSFLDSLPSLPPITCPDNTPTLTEVRSAISGLKSNKACGMDHLPAEVLSTGERISMSTCMPSSAKSRALAESLNNGRMPAFLPYTKTKVTAPTVVIAVASRCYQLVARCWPE